MKTLPLNSYTRRKFIRDVSLSSGAIILLGTGCSGCEDVLERINNRPMRMKLPNSNTPAGSKVFTDIQIYKDAVSAMKALPSSDKRSWDFQSLIHGSNVANSFNFCTHNSIHFFSWHRAYLYQFEEICRELTGEEDFALPYWNWIIDNNVPAAFLDPAPNSLYLARSSTSVGGNSFTYSHMNTIFQSQFSAFNNSLEGGPHNSGHSQIGLTMGTYQSALDPLFWTHHCMVDYCWYDWNIVRNNANPNNNSWLQQSWNHFVDRAGNNKTSTVVDTVLMPLLSYRYENTAITQASPTATPSGITNAKFRNMEDLEEVKKRLLKGRKINFSVGQSIALEAPKQLRDGGEVYISSKVSASSIDKIKFDRKLKNRRYLKVTFPTLPETNDFYVEAYLNPEGPRELREKSDKYISSFSFFGTAENKKNASRSFYLDITETFSKLRSKGAIKPADNLNFVLKMVKIRESKQKETYLESAKTSIVIADPFIDSE